VKGLLIAFHAAPLAVIGTIVFPLIPRIGVGQVLPAFYTVVGFSSALCVQLLYRFLTGDSRVLRVGAAALCGVLLPLLSAAGFLAILAPSLRFAELLRLSVLSAFWGGLVLAPFQGLFGPFLADLRKRQPSVESVPPILTGRGGNR
jgi:hypothetical protein